MTYALALLVMCLLCVLTLPAGTVMAAVSLVCSVIRQLKSVR